jgi:RHS repeat-associated protein
VKDHLGSTRTVISEDPNNGAMEFVEASWYYAYGKIMPLHGSGEIQLREQFTTKEWDVEGGMGLFYFGVRYFDPEAGTWTSTDPGRYNRSQFYSTYAYMSSGPNGSMNPINAVDPDGRWGIVNHLIRGYFNGTGIYEAKGDWYRSENPFYKPVDGKKDIEPTIHSGDPIKLDQFVNMNLEEANKTYGLDLSEQELRGLKDHAIHDYAHEAEYKAYSPIEYVLSNESRSKFQDSRDMAVVGSAVAYPIVAPVVDILTGGLLAPIYLTAHIILTTDFLLSLTNQLFEDFVDWLRPQSGGATIDPTDRRFDGRRTSGVPSGAEQPLVGPQSVDGRTGGTSSTESRRFARRR